MNFISKGLITACIFLSVFAVSCKGDEPGPTPVIPATSLTATVDGKPFYAEDITGSVTTADFFLQGIHNPGSSKQAIVQLSIPHYTSPGSYPIDTATSAGYTEAGVLMKATSGSIEVITSNEVHVKGIFFFEASAGGITKQITNGKFDLYK